MPEMLRTGPRYRGVKLELVPIVPTKKRDAATDTDPDGDGDADPEIDLLFSLSSEAPVLMPGDYWDDPYYEILDHSPESVDLSRMSSDSAPLLFGHDMDDPIGLIRKAYIDPQTRKLMVGVKFRGDQRSQDFRRDMESGVMPNVSVGYQPIEMKREIENAEGYDTYRTTRWMPYEGSLVASAADINVGLGRALSQDKIFTVKVDGGKLRERSGAFENNQPAARSAANVKVISMTQEEKDKLAAEHRAELEAAETRAKQQGEKAHARALAFIGTAVAEGVPQVAEQALRENWEDSKFYSTLVEEVKKRAGKTVSTTPPTKIGMSDDDADKFLISRALRWMMGDLTEKEVGFELEASRAAVSSMEKAGFSRSDFKDKGRSLVIPLDVLNRRAFQRQQRSLNTVSGVNGGAAVMVTNPTGTYIDLLRPKSMVLNMGISFLTGLTADVKIPRKSAAGTSSWIGDDVDPSASTQQFGTLNLSPKNVGTYTDISRSLILQSSIAVDQFVIDDLLIDQALAIDLAAMNGSGNAGAPLGLLNWSGVGSVSVGSWTWQKAVNFETTIAAANADVANMKWLTQPTTRETLKTTQKATNYPLYLQENNQVNGYPVFVSTNVPSATTIFGDWSQLLLAEWGVMELAEDRAAKFLSGGLRIRVIQSLDVGVRQVGAFAVSTNS